MKVIWRSDHPAGFALGMVVLVAVIVGVAFDRIYTLATGVADIAHYYEAAQSVRAASTWTARLQAALVWAPVHPLLLAWIGGSFGIAWTYFLNPIWVVGLLCAIGAWSWRVLDDRRAGLLTALAGAALLLFGYDQAAQSLLYPYRESLSFLCIFAAMLATLLAFPASGKPRRLWLFCAGCGYVLAAAVREPSILALFGAVAYVLARPREDGRSLATDLLVLVSPVLLAILVLAGIYISTGIVSSQQFAGWRSMSSHTSPTAWAGMYRTYLNCLVQFMGLWGSAIAAVGLVWLVRKNRAAVHALVWPLLLTVALYSTFTFHPRYALSAAVYLVPFLGAGLRAIGGGLAHGLGRSRPWVDAGICGLSAGALVVLCLVQAVHLSPWGGVTRRQIQDLGQTLQAQLAPSDRVLADPRCRLLNETLRTYFWIHPATSFDGLSADQSATIFIRPINPVAVFRAKVKVPPVSMAAAILRTADLDCVRDAAGQPIRLSLGGGEYVLHRVRPWSRTRVEQDLSGADVDDGLLWLDYQQRDAQAPSEVLMLDEIGAVLRKWSVTGGNGLIPLWVGGTDAWNPRRLVATSGSPLPSNLLARPLPTRSGGYFGLEMERRPSILSWVVPPTTVSPHDKWAAVFTGSARFAIPVPRGAEKGTFALSIWLDPRYPHSETVVFRYGGAGAEATTMTNRLDQGRIHHSIPLRWSDGGTSCQVDVAVEVPKDWSNHFRVAGLGVVRKLPD